MTPEAILALRERWQQARRYEATAGGAVFRMCNPSNFEERKILAVKPGDVSEGVLLEISRELVLASIVGWEGVTYDTLLRDGEDTPLPCKPEIARMLLEERVDILDELVPQVGEFRRAQRERQESALGN